MCRFVAYFGTKELLLNELLSKPENSLIRQSREAKEGTHGINADGFGLGWYNFNISKYPGIFKSTQPAWNDSNLLHLANKIQSSCFLSHVRASTVGSVTQNNCHPFSFNEYSFVHNGTIGNFELYRRKLINSIDEDLFLKIQGNTDSECFFFLIMDFIKKGNSLEISVNEAIKWISNAQKNSEGFSRINIVITNGIELIAVRFVSKNQKSLSLKYLIKSNSDLVLSSEALSDDPILWNDLLENHYLYINKSDMELQIKQL